ETVHSLGGATQLQQRVPEGALILGVAGSEGRRLPEGFEGLVPQPLLPQRVAQIAERLDVPWARRESGAEVRYRPRPLAASGEDHPGVVVRQRFSGIDGERLPAALERRIELTVLAQRVGESGQRLGMPGRERDGLAVTAHGLGRLPEVEQCTAEIVVGIGT